MHHQGTALCIDFGLLQAGGSEQEGFILVFDAGPADSADSPVAVAVDAFPVFLADAGQVAEHVSRRLSVRIAACGIGFQVDAGELVQVHGDAGDRFFRQVDLERGCFESAALPALLEALDLSVMDSGEFPQF